VVVILVAAQKQTVIAVPERLPGTTVAVLVVVRRKGAAGTMNVQAKGNIIAPGTAARPATPCAALVTAVRVGPAPVTARRGEGFRKCAMVLPSVLVDVLTAPPITAAAILVLRASFLLYFFV